MRIPANVILIWPSTNDSIPSLWERETTLDGRYLKGASIGNAGGTNAGSSSHTHTSTAHSHTIDNHTHTGILQNTTNPDYNDEGGASGVGETSQGHRHYITSDTTYSGTLSDAITYASVDSDPPYYEVIFIKAQTGAILQNNIIVFWDRDSEPTNWNFCDGTLSSPDLRNKYLKGVATGGNSGATGGTLNHAHDIGHTHSSVYHYHTGRSGAKFEGGCDGDQASGTQSRHCDHTHIVTFNNTALAGGAYTGTAGTAESVEPLYKKLNPIQKLTGGIKERGIIGMWLQALADIPKGWKLCNGQLWDDGITATPDLRDYFVKCANTTDEGIGSTTGGANAHTHAASNSHSHTGASHTHTGTCSASDSSVYGTGVGEHHNNKADHIHPVDTISSTTPTYANSIVTANSSDNQPLYTTVAFIQFTKELYGAAVLMAFLQ